MPPKETAIDTAILYAVLEDGSYEPIKEMKSIEDLELVEKELEELHYTKVVLCKDCKHSYQGNYFKGYACKKICVDCTYTVPADFFCKFGEEAK